MKSRVVNLRPSKHTVVKQLQLDEINPEEEVACEVTYNFCPGCSSKGEWKYSLGTPAEPPRVEVIYVGHNGRDVSRMLSTKMYDRLEDELLEAHQTYY